MKSSLPPSSVLKSKRSKKTVWSRQHVHVSASCWFLTWHTPWPWRQQCYILPKCWLTFTRLHRLHSSRQLDCFKFISLKHPTIYVKYKTQPVQRLGYELDDQGWIPGKGKRFLYSSQHPNPLWESRRSLSNSYQGFYAQDWALGARSWQLYLTMVPISIN